MTRRNLQGHVAEVCAGVGLGLAGRPVGCESPKVRRSQTGRASLTRRLPFEYSGSFIAEVALLIDLWGGRARGAAGGGGRASARGGVRRVAGRGGARVLGACPACLLLAAGSSSWGARPGGGVALFLALCLGGVSLWSGVPVRWPAASTFNLVPSFCHRPECETSAGGCERCVRCWTVGLRLMIIFPKTSLC